jgi:hypothetical protein
MGGGVKYRPRMKSILFSLWLSLKKYALCVNDC